MDKYSFIYFPKGRNEKAPTGKRLKRILKRQKKNAEILRDLKK